MKEELISIETAKLAKNKGFDLKCLDAYDKAGMLVDILTQNNLEEYFQAPTQSLLQKWLREEHEVEIKIEYSKNTKGYHAKYLKRGHRHDWIWARENNVPTTRYEVALEFALIESLKLIKH